MPLQEKKPSMAICKEVDEYIRYVRSGEIAVCEEQLLLCDFVEKVFRDEDVYIDMTQLERYLGFQKYFPYDLLPWEQFCFALHNCTYKRDGQPRFPILVIVVGRGSGKNGYLAFEDFCLTTPVNGVMYYDIDMFATSEEQAKSTFMDIHEVLENNRDYFKNYFKWNLEMIQNMNTRSVIKFHTRAPGSQDGGRPGKVDFDEYHAYKDYKLINVAVTGLGKKKHPRRTIISTHGDERDGPMDALMNDCLDILKGLLDDNGRIPFICRLDSDAEVTDKRNWHKANPSLRYFPQLLHEIEVEYADYIRDPVSNSAFMTKRMNRPRGETEFNVTEWENLVAATEELPELKGRSCVGAIDYAKINDFVVAGLLFKEGEQRYWMHHTWVCKRSRDLSRIKYPLEQAEKEGVLTFVDETEISPWLVTEWLAEQGRLYTIEAIAIDNFRYTLMADALKDIGFVNDKAKGKEKLKLVRPSDLMKAAVVIGYLFSRKLLAWGTSTIMRWYTWNTKAVTDPKGNVSYEKIEPRSRKTDGFHAFAAAVTLEDKIKQRPKIRKRIGTVT